MEEELQLGYTKDLFPYLKTDAYDCTICQRVCNQPKQCTNCGRLYCSQCLKNFEKNIGFLQCLQCEKQQFQELPQNLRYHYDQIDMLCKCGQLFKINQKQNHDVVCQAVKMPNCKNFQFCNQKVSPHLQDEGVCETACLLLSQIQQNPQDDQKMFQQINSIISKLKKGELFNGRQPIVPLVAGTIKGPNNANMIQPPNFQQPQNNINNSNNPIKFTWSANHKGNEIFLDHTQTKCYLKEQGYVFKTVLANVGFQNGCHYWEIIPEPQTENEMKIGVSLTANINMDTAFCDTNKGFAFYGLGSLRNGSNSNGSQYGRKFKNCGVLGIFLNMNKGELYFSIDGKNQGLAFKSRALSQGPIYPAIALLHHAGATLVSGLPIPNIFKQ